MTKEELEVEKLELEVKDLKKNWYRNVEFWKVFIPTLAILLSLYFTFGKGIIDSEKSKLEIQKEILKLDITRFEIRKDKLTKSIAIKDSVKINLERQIEKYENQEKDLTVRITQLNKKLNKTKEDLANINTEKAKDKKFYQDELLVQYKAEKKRLDELGILNDKLNQNKVQIASLNAELSYLNSKVKLTESEKNDLEIAKLSASSNVYQSQINSHENSLNKLREQYEAELKRINEMSTDELIRQFELNILKSETNEDKK